MPFPCMQVMCMCVVGGHCEHTCQWRAAVHGFGGHESSSLKPSSACVWGWKGSDGMCVPVSDSSAGLQGLCVCVLVLCDLLREERTLHVVLSLSPTLAAPSWSKEEIYRDRNSLRLPRAFLSPSCRKPSSDLSQ